MEQQLQDGGLEAVVKNNVNYFIAYYLAFLLN
jgi:hypothetical protein